MVIATRTPEWSADAIYLESNSAAVNSDGSLTAVDGSPFPSILRRKVASGVPEWPVIRLASRMCLAKCHAETVWTGPSISSFGK